MKAFVNLLVSFTFLIFATKSAYVPGDGGDAGPAPIVPVNQTEPKLNAFQSSGQRKNAPAANYPGSRVTITVGEDNGFHYTVNGHTYSRERIAVSGEYFNDEVHADGYARLFLDAQPSIIYYAVRPRDDRLDVYVQNYYYEDFYFEIFTPYPVTGYDLRHGQINATAVLVTGPSRSAVHGRRHVRSARSSETKPFHQFKQDASS